MWEGQLVSWTLACRSLGSWGRVWRLSHIWVWEKSTVGAEGQWEAGQGTTGPGWGLKSPPHPRRCSSEGRRGAQLGSPFWSHSGELASR